MTPTPDTTTPQTTPPKSEQTTTPSRVLRPEDFGLTPDTQLVELTHMGAKLVCTVPRASTLYTIADAFHKIETAANEMLRGQEVPNLSAYEACVRAPARTMAEIIARLSHEATGLSDETGRPIKAETITADVLLDALDIDGLITVTAQLHNAVSLDVQAKKLSASPSPSQAENATRTSASAADSESSSPSPSPEAPHDSQETSQGSPCTAPPSTSSTPSAPTESTPPS